MSMLIFNINANTDSDKIKSAVLAVLSSYNLQVISSDQYEATTIIVATQSQIVPDVEADPSVKTDNPIDGYDQLDVVELILDPISIVDDSQQSEVPQSPELPIPFDSDLETKPAENLPVESCVQGTAFIKSLLSDQPISFRCDSSEDNTVIFVKDLQSAPAGDYICFSYFGVSFKFPIDNSAASSTIRVVFCIEGNNHMFVSYAQLVNTVGDEPCHVVFGSNDTKEIQTVDQNENI